MDTGETSLGQSVSNRTSTDVDDGRDDTGTTLVNEDWNSRRN